MTRWLVVLACVAMVLGLATLCLRSGLQYRTESVTRAVVLGFEDLAFDQRMPREATLRYFSPAVVDHDPELAGGRADIIARLEKLDWSTGGPQRIVKHFMVDGEYAMVHHHLIRKPGERGIAAMDMFRVVDGLIVEHWDVLQPLPESSINPRAMF